MKNLWDHWVSIDISAVINHESIKDAKRGSKRFCGRIVKNGRDPVTVRPIAAFNECPDLFFDSTSPVDPWYR